MIVKIGSLFDMFIPVVIDLNHLIDDEWNSLVNICSQYQRGFDFEFDISIPDGVKIEIQDEKLATLIKLRFGK
jgi:hypothetical protein